jgi:undecaprenyl-phosphate galactose phosphotransferase/putative colanic acid biosynthesis UDP-glucose lipid carrier transferase
VSTVEPDVANPTVDQRPHGLAFRYIEPLAFLGDSIVIFLASIVCGVGYHLLISDQVGSIEDFVAISVLFWVNFAALTSAQRNYRVENLINRGRQLRYVTLNWWLISLVLIGVAFTLKVSDHFSRGATLSFFIIGWSSLVAYRFTLAHQLSLALARGTFAQKKIVVIAERGQLNSGKALIDLRRCGYSPVKTIEFTQAELEAVGIGKSVQTKVNDVISVCQSEAIDHIVILIKWGRRQFIDDLARMLRVVAIPVNLLPDENATQLLKARTVNVGTAWTVELQRAPLSNTEQNFKRAFDLSLAAVAIVILSPLMLMTALMIKFDSDGPVFFKQRRHGFSGRTFVIYKFRTMRVLEDGNVVRQATRQDPRVTRLGRWLRQTSIDELPQLFNVLSGQMSLVGPRPHAVAHNDEYQKVVANYALRHHMKPGITGWAQVSGHRGETETVDKMERRVEHDLWYINHWSPWLDLRILFKTVLLASRQPTAY